MFQDDVGVMGWPYDTVHIPRHRNEEGRVGELFDGAFDDLTDLNFAHLQKLLLEDRRSHSELQKPVQWIIASNSGSMYCADFPRS